MIQQVVQHMKSAHTKQSKPYLLNRGGIFYFRMAYPQTLIDAMRVHHGEFKMSLKTFDPREAQRISYYLSDNVGQFFTEVALQAGNMHHDEIKKLIRGYFEKKLLNYSENFIRARSVAPTEPNEFEPEYLRSLTREAKAELQRLQGIQAGQFYGAGQEKIANRILTQRGINLNHTSDLFHELCYGILRADMEAERIHYANLIGNFQEAKITDNLFSGCRDFFENPNPTLHFESHGHLYLETDRNQKPKTALSVAISDYFNYRRSEIKQHNQSEYKLREYYGFFKRLMEIWGEDQDITTIDKKDGAELRKIILRFPKRFTDIFAKKGHTLMDVLNSKQEYDVISPAQAKKMWSNFQQFFKWCVEQSYIESSPLDGIEVKGKKHSIDDRNPFTIEQLQKLFNCSIYTGRKYRSRCPWEAPNKGQKGIIIKDAHYWIPLVGLFSGLRAGEILTLRIMDIRYDDKGTVYFDINTDAEGKTLKTPESKRRVPIHPELIKMGLVKYWQEEGNQRNQEDNLFTGVPIPKERPSNKYSNKFSDILSKIGVKTEKTSFHSFRHNFSDQLRRLATGVTEEMKDALDGRRSESGGSRRLYGHRLEPSVLYEAIKQVKYDLDLSHLYVE